MILDLKMHVVFCILIKRYLYLFLFLTFIIYLLEWPVLLMTMNI